MELEGLNPLTLGDTPEEYVENSDGSVDIPTGEEVIPSEDFFENLADVLPTDELNDLSSELMELIEKDKKSREKRDKQYEEGIRRTGLGDDAPGGAEFEGASKVVHPVLAEACVDFSSRAIKELFPSAGPVKSWIIGETTTKKAEKAQRKTKFMNWQLTTQMQEYRDELEQLLTQLPMGGSQYQKFWYDDRMKRPRCEFVPVDEIFLPFAATSFYTSPRVTHRQPITRYEFKRRVKSGLYRDIFLVDTQTPERSSTSNANDKIEGREEDGYNEDGLRAVLEIYTWREMEGDERTDGEYAPYIITIDEDTEEVLAIYRNWDEQDATFEKLDWFVEWKFIPWRGAYAIGLPHLIGGLAAALTGALRALLDSAHINNAPTMLKLKSGRINGQNTQVDVTQVCDIEGPAGIDDIKKLAMAMPFNPPSPVLAGLMDSLYGLAKGVVATAEDKVSQVGDRTPVGTTMALIEQGSNTYSAIHARLHESQKKALSILHRIDAAYLDEQNYVEELGELTVSREDFLGSMDVIPVSDPTIFSEAQRFAQMQAIIQMSADQTVQWNKVNVYRRALKQMRIEAIDELLPPSKDPLTADLLTENSESLNGTPLKAGMDQDHMSHIKGHLAFVMSPLQYHNPLVPPEALLGVLNHIGEHIQMLQTKTTLSSTLGSNDSDFVAGMEQAQALLIEHLGPVMQQLTQIQPELQKRVPPPPMPPEVQASLEIAKMDTARKTELDKATNALKQQEFTAKQQTEQGKFQADQNEQMYKQNMEQTRQRFTEYMEQMRVQLADQAEKASQRIDMMKNEADNHQKQTTELLKNRDDNDTKYRIEMQKMMGEIHTQMTAPKENTQESTQPDMSPQLEKLQVVLDQMGKQQTNDALASVMEGLRATIETLNRPKTIVRDAQGKAQGIQ